MEFVFLLLVSLSCVSCDVQMTCAPTGNALTDRSGHTATVVTNSAFVIGGVGGPYLASVEEMNSVGASERNPLTQARSGHAAALLGSTILVVGGKSLQTVNTAELYNVNGAGSTETISFMSLFGHTLTALNASTAVLIGGAFSDNGATGQQIAFIFRLSTKSFQPTTKNLTTARAQHTSTLLRTGEVLVVGGTSVVNSESIALPSAEIFEPGPLAFRSTIGLSEPRYSHTATLLSSGNVIVVGGYSSGLSLAGAELYTDNKWRSAGRMSESRNQHSAAFIDSLKAVVVVGGIRADGVTPRTALATADIYFEDSDSWSTLAAIPETRWGHTSSSIASSAFLLVGGARNYANTNRSNIPTLYCTVARQDGGTDTKTTIIIVVVVVVTVLCGLGFAVRQRRRNAAQKRLSSAQSETHVVPGLIGLEVRESGSNQPSPSNLRVAKQFYPAPEQSSKGMQIQERSRNGLPMIRPDELKIQEFIGEGQFAVVHKAQWMRTEQTVVVKTLKPTADQKQEARLVDEAERQWIACRNHPHLVQVIGFCREPKPALVLSFANRGSLHTLTTNGTLDATRRHDREKICAYMSQVASAMEHLHQKGIVHCDIAARNIFIHDDAALLGDFGLARSVADVDTDAVKPLQWCAPETLGSGNFTKESDVYMWGVTLWEALAGEPPLRGYAAEDLKILVPAGLRPEKLPLNRCPPTLWNYINACFLENPDRRPLVTELRSLAREHAQDEQVLYGK